jgi:hypothetical protein
MASLAVDSVGARSRLQGHTLQLLGQQPLGPDRVSWRQATKPVASSLKPSSWGRLARCSLVLVFLQILRFDPVTHRACRPSGADRPPNH